MTIPPLSDEQRQQARHAATEARRRRAEVKQALRTGERTLADVLEEAEYDDVIAHAKVLDVLKALPRVGSVRATKVMDRLDIAANRRLRGLGKHQLAALVAEFAPRPPDVPLVSAGPPVQSPRLTVVSGPTAVGKGTVVAALAKAHPDIFVSVSATTRPPRPGEVDGVHYLFASEAEFDELVAGGLLLEWAVVHGVHRYGTPKAPVLAALAAGRPAILEIDLQGARQVRTSWPEAQFVFLAPPSWEELVRRLVGRGTESDEQQQRRLVTARAELASQSEFDFVVVNREVGQAVDELVELACL